MAIFNIYVSLLEGNMAGKSFLAAVKKKAQEIHLERFQSQESE
jgi:hypothetical protein